MRRMRARKIADSLLLTRVRTILRPGWGSRLACIRCGSSGRDGTVADGAGRPAGGPRAAPPEGGLHGREFLLHLGHVGVHVRLGHEQHAGVGDLGERLPLRGVEERLHREPAHLEGLLDDAERDRAVADALERVLEVVEACDDGAGASKVMTLIPARVASAMTGTRPASSNAEMAMPSTRWAISSSIALTCSGNSNFCGSTLSTLTSYFLAAALKPS